MAVMVTMDAEASLEDYRKVNAVIEGEGDPPAGLILHAGAQTEAGKVKIVDIWESQDAAQAFYRGRLASAIAQVAGPDGGPPPSPPEFLEIEDLVKP
jgi:hypothetical protein